MLDEDTLRRKPKVLREEKLLDGVIPASDPYAGDGDVNDGTAKWPKT